MQNLLVFHGNKPHLVLEMNFDKVVIVGGSNNRGLGAEPPAAGGQQVFGDGAPDVERFFTSYSKKYAFLSLLWS